MTEKEKELTVVRAGGKAYLGRLAAVDMPAHDHPIMVLIDAVEIITVMMPGPGGLAKTATVAGMDYSAGPVKQLLIPNPDAYYYVDYMKHADVKKLTEDYESVKNQDNLVQSPPTIVDPSSMPPAIKAP